MIAKMGDPKKISRRFSICGIMQAIIHCGPISRASLARQTGLSKQTISEIVRHLVEEGWICQTGRTRGHIGRQAITYELVPEAAYIASADLGGTKLRVSIANLGSAAIGDLTEATDHKGGLHTARQIARMIKTVALTNSVDLARVHLAVIGVPGVPDMTTGRVALAPNIRRIGEVDFTGLLRKELGIPIVLENDVNLAAFGEKWAGCGSDRDDLAFVSLGTGLGAGLIINGNLVRGFGGAAGELGYLPFGENPFEPESLASGALERRLGSEGLRERYRQLGGNLRSVREIFDQASAGDVSAITVLDEAARLLAQLIAALGAVVNPSVVVLGGSIGQRTELFERVVPLLKACIPYPLRVERTRLGDRAALAGGVAIGLTHLHSMLFADGLEPTGIVIPQPETTLAGKTG